MLSSKKDVISHSIAHLSHIYLSQVFTFVSNDKLISYNLYILGAGR